MCMCFRYSIQLLLYMITILYNNHFVSMYKIKPSQFGSLPFNTYHSLRLVRTNEMLQLTLPAALLTPLRSQISEDRKLVSIIIQYFMKRIILIEDEHHVTFIHEEFVGSRRPLKVTVSSEWGDKEPVILITGIFNVFDDCGVPDGVRAIFKSVRCTYELMSMARLVGFTSRSK